MKIVIFSPYSFIRQWRLADLFIGQCLQENNEIILLECQGYQKFCVSMMCAGLDWESDQATKANICRDCQSFTRLTTNLYKNKSIQLDNYLKKNDLLEIEKYLAQKLQSQITIDNVDITGPCSYSLLIQHQLRTLNEVKEKFPSKYEQEIENGLKTFYAGKNFFKEINPDVLLMHNGLYSVGNILSQIAQENNCKVYTHTNGSNRQTFDDSLRVAKGNYYEQIEKLKKIGLKKVIVNKKQKNVIKKHLNALQTKRFSFSYSEPKRNHIPHFLSSKIRNRKTALLTTSSFDELAGALRLGYKKEKDTKNIFQNQNQWILQTIKFFKKNKQHFLIIRIHPREFSKPFNENSAPSFHCSNLLKIIKKRLASNIFLNLPNQHISLYDLLKITKLVINGWSSAGEEASLFAKNVITAFPKYSNVPKELLAYPKSKKHYFNLIKKGLNYNKTQGLQCMHEKWHTLSKTLCEVPVPNFQILANNLFISKNLIEKALFRILPNKYIKYKINKCFSNNTMLAQSRIKKLILQNQNFFFEAYLKSKK